VEVPPELVDHLLPLPPVHRDGGVEEDGLVSVLAGRGA
jgi:hypothetical protein